jgi:hypothetical protein
MNQHELAERRIFEFRVLNEMRCATFDFEAYRTMPDLRQRKRAALNLADSSAVSKYRWIFRVPTHISRTQLTSQTEIGVNTDVIDYPRKPPSTWILSDHVPWSPHFLRGAPVCVGDELWAPASSHITLGELAIHIAHLLNWDEKVGGPGYAGWNGDAIAHHQRMYGGRPVNPDLKYPTLPAWLSGRADATPFFRILGRDQPPGSGFRIHR